MGVMLEDDVKEKCGVGAVKLFGPAEDFPKGGAAFYCIEIGQDQKNRGELSTGMAYLNQEAGDEIIAPRIHAQKGLGSAYDVFGKPGSEEHSKNCSLCEGDAAIIHNRYDTSSRKKSSGGTASLEDRLASLLKSIGNGDNEQAVREIEQIKEQVKNEKINDLLDKKTVLAEAHPFVKDHAKRYKSFAFCFNGNISNAGALRDELLKQNKNYSFETGTDTEVIKVLIEKEVTKYDNPLQIEDFKKIFFNISQKLKGSYTLAYLDGNGNLVFLADPQKFRPAVFGIKKNDDKSPRMFAAASETSALQRIGLGKEDIYELEPGNMIIASNEGIKGPFVYAPSPRKSHCIFELVYFAKAISQVFGIDVHLARRLLGGALAGMEEQTL